MKGDPQSDPGRLSLEPDDSDGLAEWNPATRILFRISFCYFAIYAAYAFSILTALVTSQQGKPPFFPLEAGLHGFIPWVGRHVLGIRQPIEFGDGSGRQSV